MQIISFCGLYQRGFSISFAWKVRVVASPDDADNDAKEEDVDEDGDDGGDGQEEDTLPRIHPTVDVLVVMSEKHFVVCFIIIIFHLITIEINIIKNRYQAADLVYKGN